MNGLPEGWADVRLDEITEPDAPIIYGILQPGPHIPDGVPFIRPIDVQGNRVELSRLPRTTPEIAARYKRSTLRSGDIVVSIVGTIGKIIVVSSELEGGNITQSSCVIRCNGGLIDRRYVVSFLRSPQAWSQYRDSLFGTAVQRLNLADVRALHISVPPLAEQRRIVAKLDALDASANRARADLDRIPTLVGRAKQAILAREFDQIVEGCDLVPFGEMLEHLTSGSRDWSSYYDRGSCVFVLAGNIRPLYFDPEPKKIIAPPLDSRDAQRSRIQKNDLLLTIVGAGTGDICVVPSDYENYFVCQSVALMRLKDPRLASFFSYWFNGEKHGQGDFTQAMYGAARPHLSFDQIREFPIPLVSSPQADACVRRIESAFAKIDRIAAEAASARGLLDRLDQAILAKAFRGELVPQDPSDEPAEKLLEKIKAARASPTARTTRKKQS